MAQKASVAVNQIFAGMFYRARGFHFKFSLNLQALIFHKRSWQTGNGHGLLLSLILMGSRKHWKELGDVCELSRDLITIERVSCFAKNREDYFHRESLPRIFLRFFGGIMGVKGEGKHHI